jgi:phospholipid-binding lipoprotein MlaA
VIHAIFSSAMRSRFLLAAGALVLTAGCATTGGDSRDPFEGFNRSMYGFNQTVDEAVLKPVAKAYKSGLPEMVQTGVRNFFSNLADIFISVNNLLQGKVVEAANDGMRFALNTTIGGFGVLDWASEMGLEKHNEDFGQTFGRWGVGDGPYIVWPLLGSSTARDSVGEVIDIRVDPVSNHKPIAARNAMYLTRVVGKRADLLDASRILEEAALDKYVFERDAYLQRRRNLIYDGNPPRESARAAPSPEAGGASRGEVIQAPGDSGRVLTVSADGDGDLRRAESR